MSTQHETAGGMVIERANGFASTKAIGVCLLVAGSIATYEAQAVWDIVPEVEMAVEIDDNPRLGVDVVAAAAPNDGTKTVVDGRVDLSNIGQRGEIFFQPRARVDAYAESENEDLESEDLFLRANGEYRWQMASLGFASYFSSESILSSELEDALPLDPNLVDPIDTSSGNVDVVNEDRNRAIFAPYVEFGISQRNSFLFETRFIDATYTGDANQASDRSDFTDTLFAAGIVRNLDERNVVTARLRASQFEAAANQNVTDTFAVEGTFTRPINELWSMNLGVGVQRSDYAFVDEDGEFIDNADTNYSLDLRFEHRTELTIQNFSIRRSMNPNSLGFLVERNEIAYNVSRQITPRITGIVGARAIQSRTLDNIKQDNDRDYARAQVGVEWGLTQNWVVSADYIYTFQEFASQTRDTNSNAFIIGVNYRGLSRLQP